MNIDQSTIIDSNISYFSRQIKEGKQLSQEQTDLFYSLLIEFFNM